jgi:hypothetical protein
VTAPGRESFAYSPYLVLVGALGKLSGVTPYRALQFAGVANLCLFAAGTALFFSRHSLHRRWELPAAFFVFATLFLRWKHFGWSSETSVLQLQYLQAYPSTIASALALFVFALMKPATESWRWPVLLALSVLLGVLLVTHALTASWSVGIVGLYGLYASLQARRAAPLARAVAALGIGFSVALLWPYSPLLGQSSITHSPEGSPFGKAPLQDFKNLYWVALPSAAYLTLRLRKHAFWVLGFLATLGALKLWRTLHYDYGNRYSLFAAFFAQFLLAEMMALGAFALFASKPELSAQRRFSRLERWFAIALLFSALVAWLPAPYITEHRAELRWPIPETAAISPHDAYYARFTELRRHLSENDIVLMPNVHLVFDIAAITGARFVSAPYTVRVADQAARAHDVNAFFDPATDPDTRDAIARRRGATKVLLLNWQFEALLRTFRKDFGRPVYKDREMALFVVDE